MNELIEQLRTASKADDTLKSIDKWIRLEPDPTFGRKGIYVEWCIEKGFEPFPCPVPQLEKFLAHLYQQGHSISTVKQAVGSIDNWHKKNEEFCPGTSEKAKTLLHGIIRTISSQGRGQQKSKDAITIDDLKKIEFKDTVGDLRNKAIALVMFAGGLRKGEAQRMLVEHITYTGGGFNLMIPFSKANQTGDFEKVSIMKGSDPEWCPVKVLVQWMERAEITEGPVWRRVDRYGAVGSKPLSPHAIYLAIKNVGIRAGFASDDIGSHSMRSGCATYLLDKGIPAHVVQKHLRHKKFDSTQIYNKNKTAKKLEGVY